MWALHGGRGLPRAAFRVVSTLSTIPSTSSLAIRNRPSDSCRFLLSLNRQLHLTTRRYTAAAPQHEQIPEDGQIELNRFQDLADRGLVSPSVINTITGRMNIETMTDVQKFTISETLDGTDVIAQAKTGTGKTLAFLIPIVQRLLKDKRLEQKTYHPSPVDIRALIVSPTRELAEQIAVEAKKVVSATNIQVQTAVGGTGKSMALQRMRRQGCHILVGTPGRLNDILSDSYSGVKLDNIEVFVLDEADRLLDIGFAPEIEAIQASMPSVAESKRQTLMFSATVPKSVVGLVQQTLRPDFKFIRTSDPGEVPTHERIPQKVAFIRGLENRLPVILEIAHNAIKAHEEDPMRHMPFKAIVYFGATADVNLTYEIFANMRGSLDGSMTSKFQHPLYPTQIIQMHSRLTQAERTRNSAQFRNAKSALLFSSDVTARGMDFPDVSHVIQVGLPRNDDDYVHRLGRTGRAGKPGEGWLIALEHQMRDFNRGLGADLPIQRDSALKTASLDLTQPADLPAEIVAQMNLIHTGVKTTPFAAKAQAYNALLSIMGNEGFASKQQAVDSVNDLARYGWGMQDPPLVEADKVKRLGLARTIGLNIRDSSLSRRDSDNSSFPSGQRHRENFDQGNPFGDLGGRTRGYVPGNDSRSQRGQYQQTRRGAW